MDTEARYRRIVEAQSELISLSRRDGTLVYVNPAYARQFGTTPERLIGRSLHDLVQEEDRVAVRAHIERVFDSGEMLRNVNRLVDPTGREGWFSWTDQIHAEPDGERLLHSVGRDVTERIRTEQALRASRAFLDRTGAVAGVGGWQLDIPTGEMVWSDQTKRIHEVSLDYQPTLAASVGFFAPAAQARIEEAVHQALADGQPWDLELPLVTAAGREIWVRAVGEVKRENGEAVRLVGAFQDITDRRRIESELTQRTEMLRSITEVIPAVIAVLDRDQRYRLVNTAFERWLGVPRDRILGRTIGEVLGDADARRIDPWARRALAGETVSYERDCRQHGTLRHMAVSYAPLWGADRQVQGFVGMLHDITQHRREEGRLLEIAYQDALTGLLNRAGFEHALALGADGENTAPLALLYIDLDRFKPVNDCYGHAVGDEVLRQFARRLRGVVRPDDAVARLGGDEFVVMLTGLTDPAPAERVAAAVVEAAAQPFIVGPLKLEVGASVGVAHSLRGHADSAELLRRADAMLYRAKAQGRGRLAA